MVVRMMTPEVAAADAELAARLDALETARARLQGIYFEPFGDLAFGHRVPEVLALWDRLRGTIADLLAALPAGMEQ